MTTQRAPAVVGRGAVPPSTRWLHAMCLAALSLGLGACLASERPPPTAPGRDGHPPRDLRTSEQAAIVECLWCSSGSAPPAGSCQAYDCGGSSSVHYYACCNNCVGGSDPPAPLDGVEFDGASDGDYCGPCGANLGGGCLDGDPFPADPSLQDRCKRFCDTNAVSFPGACWNWTSCFAACVADGDPGDGVDGWLDIGVCNESSCDDLLGDDACDDAGDCARLPPCVDREGRVVPWQCQDCRCVCPVACDLEEGDECAVDTDCDPEQLEPCEDEEGNPVPYVCEGCSCVCPVGACGNGRVEEAREEQCEQPADCEERLGEPCRDLEGNDIGYVCDECQCFCSCGPPCFDELTRDCLPAGSCDVFPQPTEEDPTIERVCWSNGTTILLDESGLPSAVYRDGQLCYTVTGFTEVGPGGSIFLNLSYYDPDGVLRASGRLPIPTFSPFIVTCPPDTTEYEIDLSNPVCNGAIQNPGGCGDNCPPP